jgi:hypothetical protein
MRKRAARLVLRSVTACPPAALLACALLASLSASATSIPPDLAARADQLRREASPQVLAWIGEQARALAKGHGPVDVAALQAAARSRFARKQIASGNSATPLGAPYDKAVRNMGMAADGDIEAICFIVLMEATKDMDQDLKMIMDDVKATTHKKAELRAVVSSVQKTTPTPTPAPDRAAELLARARALVDKTQAARLSRVAPR